MLREDRHRQPKGEDVNVRDGLGARLARLEREACAARGRGDWVNALRLERESLDLKRRLNEALRPTRLRRAG